MAEHKEPNQIAFALEVDKAESFFMDQEQINRFRLDLLSDDLRTHAIALRSMMRSPAAETTSLIPDIYTLFCSNSPAMVSYMERVIILHYKKYAVPFLLELWKSDSLIDRFNAVELLALLDGQRSSYGIVEHILEDRPNELPDWGEHYDEVLSLLNQATSDSNIDIQVAAAVALDDLGQPPDNFIECFIQGLSSPDIMIRNRSALHLGRFGPLAEKALPALEAFIDLQSCREHILARPFHAARQAISLIRGTDLCLPQPAIQYDKKYTVPFLLDLIEAKSPIDRRSAVELLNTPDHTQKLYNNAINGHILRDRSGVLPDWGEYSNDVLAGFEKATTDSNIDVRIVAIAALCDIGQPTDRFVKSLAEGLGSKDSYIQTWSGFHLAHLGPLATEALPALEAFVELQTRLEYSLSLAQPFRAAQQAIRRIKGTGKLKGGS